jgi:hypothetical protein
MKRKNIAEQLFLIESSLSGAMNTKEIQSKMAALGYTPEQIAEGVRLLERAKKMISTQVEDYSDKYSVSVILSKQWPAAYSMYMITLKVVRVAFKGEVDMLIRFKATGKRRRTLSGWLLDANIFYTNLLDTPAAIERMSRFGYTVERLQEEQKAVNEIESLYNRRLTETGEAQQSTVEKDKALDELYDWYSDFRAIARIALYDTPQLLEALGIRK